METGPPQINRGEPGFDRRIDELVFNKLPLDRAPDVVVAPRTEDEVVEVVRAARAAGHGIAVLSGGHSWIAAAVKGEGVLIDMSAFAQVEVDVEARTARVGAAARSGVLSETLAAQNLAFCSGHCGTPAFAGYVLGGGLGLNWGRWKPACYSLRSVRVVTAAGELVVASESENAELLWLARGSGPAFPGVITELEIELHDRPADTRVSTWVFDYGDLAAVGRWVSEVSPALPPTVEIATSAIGPVRPEFTPEEGFPDRVVIVAAMVFAEDDAEARAAVAPLAAGPGTEPLAHNDLEPVPFEQLHKAFDAEFPEDHRYLADTFWTDLDVDQALAPVEQAFLEAPSPQNVVLALMPGNGSKLGLALADAAYSMDERTIVMAYAVWQDPEADEANRSWHAGMSELLEPISSGHFVSEADLAAHPGRLERCFTPANWERLLTLRAQWDPDGLFLLPPGIAL